jgi:FtsH-binding integral membrane protein
LTLFVFAGLTAFVFVTKADLGWMGKYLFWAGLVACGAILCMVLFNVSGLGLIFTVAMIALASGYILYSTSNVMHHYQVNQHVAAALALFAAVALLFWYILQLLMRLQSRD